MASEPGPERGGWPEGEPTGELGVAGRGPAGGPVPPPAAWWARPPRDDGAWSPSGSPAARPVGPWDTPPAGQPRTPTAGGGGAWPPSRDGALGAARDWVPPYRDGGQWAGGAGGGWAVASGGEPGDAAKPSRARRRRRSRALRRGVALGAVVVVAAGAGAVAGHLAWPRLAGVSVAAGSSAPSSAGSSGSGASGSGGSGSGSSGAASGSGGSAGSGSAGSGSAGSGAIGPGSSGSGSGGLSPFGGFFPGAGSGSSGATGGSSSGTEGAGSPAPSEVAAVAKGVDPGLVDINTVLGYQGEEAAGTGMVLTSSGEILTNNHVVEGATKITVTDVATGATYPATVVGYDRTRDVAVLQVDATGLQTVRLGNSASVAVGESIVSVGNAGGAGGTPSAVGGAVTALDQSLTAEDSGTGGSERLSGMIETNAPIQPGDSGGPLVTVSGKVVGMDTAASTGSTSIPGAAATAVQAFAIPIDRALRIAREIESHQASSTVHVGPTAFLGVEVQAAGASASPVPGGGGFGGSAGGFGGFGGGGGSGATTPAGSGVEIAGVLTGSPAANAGLGAGDTLTGVDGTSITSSSGLVAELDTLAPGDHATITWTGPSGNTHSATVALASGPPQ